MGELSALQDITCPIGISTGHFPDKRRRFFDFWCFGTLFSFISSVKGDLFGLVLNCWTNSNVLKPETSCSMCRQSYPFKGRLRNDDFRWQKVCWYIPSQLSVLKWLDIIVYWGFKIYCYDVSYYELANWFVFVWISSWSLLLIHWILSKFEMPFVDISIP